MSPNEPVTLTGEGIRARLTAFAAKWSLYTGTERSEAQTFLNQLLGCYGTSRREIGAEFESRQQTRFLDLLWPGVCIIEMKAPSEADRLSKHRKQALDYWHGAWRPIADLRRQLDVAVLAAYDWPAGLRDDALELKVRLAERHEAIDSGGMSYDPFGAA